MTDPQHTIRLWLRDRLEERGHGAKGQLASELGVRPDAITRMLATEDGKERRDIRLHELRAMEQFFGSVAPGDQDAQSVPLMGYIGAGAEIEPDFEQVPEEGLERIEIPFPLPAEMIALQVRGSSMLPQFKDGTIIIVFREQRRPLESFFGEEAAVMTTDGRRFIKTITKSGDSITLISWNSEPIENVKLTWIGEIFTIFPASAIRRSHRQGGIQGRLRLKAG